MIDQSSLYSYIFTSPEWLVLDPSLVGPPLRPWGYRNDTIMEVPIEVGWP